MKSGRREFIRTAAIAGSLPMVAPSTLLANPSSIGRHPSGQGLFFRFRPYELQLRHAFTLAGSSRTTTPVMLTEIEFEGVTGYGEASMPPYLGESHATATAFLSRLRLDQFNDPFRTDEILKYVDMLAPGNPAAKASVDIALHDLQGKLLNQPLYRIWGLSPEKTPFTSFTIGIDTEEVVRQKVREAAGFKILKVKLGRENDREMIRTIRSVTDVPLCVDVNQGWKEKEAALDMIFWLKEQGIVFVEQPIAKERTDDTSWLTERSPLPIIADEFIQRIDDVKKAWQVYSGINIKLMKCTGIREAMQMIQLARGLGMKVMLGCMTETSCAVSAAAQLSPLVDWADLDGNLLISNDLYKGVQVSEGKLVLSDRPGIGIVKTANP
jgi:L-alanine-DL-glutamate epimerase-like enolase superfamily enzyme